MRTVLKKYIVIASLVFVVLTTACKMEYVELKETETAPLATVDSGYVAKEVVVTPTIDFEEVFNPTESTESIESDIASPSDADNAVLTSADTEIDIEAVAAIGLGELAETTEAVEASQSEIVEETTTAAQESIKTNSSDNRTYDGELNVLNAGTWQYGRTPCEWIFVEPGIQLISNYRPNSSVQYAINKRVSSGDKGCYIPVFTSTEMKGDGYEARFYVFEDYTKDRPDNMLFDNTLDSLTYNGKTIEEILMNHKKLSKTKNGILVDGSNYINIVYVTDLDKMLSDDKR